MAVADHLPSDGVCLYCHANWPCTTAKVMQDTARELFDYVWRCGLWQVAAHQRSVTAPCTPTHPHLTGDCGHRWEATLTEAEAVRYGLDAPAADPKVEAMAQVLWGYYGDSPEALEWADLPVGTRTEYRTDALRVLDRLAVLDTTGDA